MPGAKKKKGGKKQRRTKKDGEGPARTLKFKAEGEKYAKVTKLLGDCRLLVETFPEKKEVIAHIRGKFRKKVWIRVDDIVLIGLRNNDEKADIIWKYFEGELKTLAKRGDITLEEKSAKEGNNMWLSSDEEGDEDSEDKEDKVIIPAQKNPPMMPPREESDESEDKNFKGKDLESILDDL